MERNTKVITWAVVALLAGLVIGGLLVYAVADNNDTQEAQEETIKTLENKVDELQDEISELKESEASEKGDEGDNTAVETSEPEIISNLFDVETAEVGDQYGTMTLVSLDEVAAYLRPEEETDPSQVSANNFYAVFEGETTVSGTYRYYASSEYCGGPDIVFEVDESSQNRVPENTHSEKRLPIRFEDIPGTIDQLVADKSADATGSATIKFEGYELFGSDGFGLPCEGPAELIEVIE